MLDRAIVETNLPYLPTISRDTEGVAGTQRDTGSPLSQAGSPESLGLWSRRSPVRIRSSTLKKVPANEVFVGRTLSLGSPPFYYRFYYDGSSRRQLWD